MNDANSKIRTLLYCALAAVTMGYGWGYRGTVGHEAGAMVPGALLALVLCVASGRADWMRRAAVAGLCGAAGWAWGGSLSYMEQTFYILSDSLPDVVYGFAAIFFLGALWAGCGGAVLGLGLTAPRSELNALARVFAAVCGVFFLVYLYFLAVPEHREAYETFTVRHFHDGDWLAATLTLLVAGVYAIVRPRDRAAALLFVAAAVAWWLGYGVLTKLGGLRLAPLHRSESWGGVLGILIVLGVYLHRRDNRAALMLLRYGCLGGGVAFVLAVFIHHPLVLRWGPLADVRLPIPAWRMAEVAFGFFMGLAMALGAQRLARGNLAAPEEDADRAPLDVFAVFVMLIALTWINFRRHFARVLDSPDYINDATVLWLGAPVWHVLLGALVTLPAIYLLYRYRQGDRSLVPASAFGKGAALLMLLLWGTVAGQLLDGQLSRLSLPANLCLWLPAALATALFAFFAGRPETTMQSDNLRLPGDAHWRMGKGYVALCALVPALVLGAAYVGMGMQDGAPGQRGRLRFGPEAYWRQTARLEGTWTASHRSLHLNRGNYESDDLPIAALEFDAYRNVTHVLESGERIEAHRWFLKNQFIWLAWYAKEPDHAEHAETPIQFFEGEIFIAWPPSTGAEGYVVFSRVGRAE